MPEYRWSRQGIRALRHHLGLSQSELARELGVRQATVSEWENGLYQPRGASARLLTLVAERAEFAYGAGSGQEAGGSRQEAGSRLQAAGGRSEHDREQPDR